MAVGSFRIWTWNTRSMRAHASFGMHVEACSMIDLRSRTAVGCNLNGWPAGGEPTEHACGELEIC